MIPLKNEEKKIHLKQKVSYICKKGFSIEDDDNEKYYKVRHHCNFTGKYRKAAPDISNLRYKTPKEIPVVLQNGSTYDYDFIIKELAEEFDYFYFNITFSVPIKKELDNGKTIAYKISLIDSFRIMSSSLSNLVDNLFERLHSDKRTDYKSYLDYMVFKDYQLIFSCFECKNNYKKDINKELIKRFANIYEFCNEDIDKFILLLRKGVYPYEYMDSWERIDATSLPNKKAFYSSLNMEDIIDVHNRHAKRVLRYFNKKNLGDYHDFYVQLELLTNADMILMVEKSIEGGICHAIDRYAKVNNKYMKNCDKNKESSYIEYLDANNLYIWAISQKLPVNGFKWKKKYVKIQ